MGVELGEVVERAREEEGTASGSKETWCWLEKRGRRRNEKDLYKGRISGYCSRVVQLCDTSGRLFDLTGGDPDLDILD